MIKFDKKIGKREVTFLFEQGEYAGELYVGQYHICRSPVCRCENIKFDLRAKPGSAKSEQAYTVNVDIFTRQLSEAQNTQDVYERNFTKSFIDELTDEDWKSLQQLFYGYKAYLTEHTPTEEIDADFPMIKEIEKSKEMVSYVEILPYARQLSVEVNGEEFIIDDIYCVAVNCNCQKALLSFFPVDPEEMNKMSNAPYESDSYLDIFLDYKRNTWKNQSGMRGTITPDALVNEVFRGGLHKIIEKRHTQLRFLYKKFRIQNLELNPVVNKISKVGRNEPCPCGSGKKYKKCCLRN